MKRQRGSTLVELMLSMGAGSAVMLLGISLVHQTMTLNAMSRKGADRNRTLDQLSHQFRSDLHSAKEVELLSDRSMTMRGEDGSIATYIAEGNFVVRERKLAIAGDERERFVLDNGTFARFEKRTNPDRACFIVSKELGLHDVPPRVELMVETIVGRWQALERNERGAK